MPQPRHNWNAPIPSKELPYYERGGKRPGAGAPRGNTNAFRSGRHSRQLKALLMVLAQIPLFKTLIIQDLLRNTPRPSRAQLRRFYLELLAHSLAAQIIQSKSMDQFEAE